VSVVGTAGPDFMPAFQNAMRETGADLRSVSQSTLPTYRWRAEHDYETGTTRNETSDQGAYRGFTPVLTADQRKAKSSSLEAWSLGTRCVCWSSSKLPGWWRATR